VRRRLVAAIVALLVVAGCSGDGDGAPPAIDEPRDGTDADGQRLDEPVEGEGTDDPVEGTEGVPEVDSDPQAPPPDPSGSGAPDGPLAFQAPLLDGGELVDAAATFGGGPVLLWMWAPW
jgi:hypothetical protein